MTVISKELALLFRVLFSVDPKTLSIKNLDFVDMFISYITQHSENDSLYPIVYYLSIFLCNCNDLGINGTSEIFLHCSSLVLTQIVNLGENIDIYLLKAFNKLMKHSDFNELISNNVKLLFNITRIMTIPKLKNQAWKSLKLIISQCPHLFKTCFNDIEFRNNTSTAFGDLSDETSLILLEILAEQISLSIEESTQMRSGMSSQPKNCLLEISLFFQMNYLNLKQLVSFVRSSYVNNKKVNDICDEVDHFIQSNQQEVTLFMLPR